MNPDDREPFQMAALELLPKLDEETMKWTVLFLRDPLSKSLCGPMWTWLCLQIEAEHRRREADEEPAGKFQRPGLETWPDVAIASALIFALTFHRQATTALADEFSEALIAMTMAEANLRLQTRQIVAGN